MLELVERDFASFFEVPFWAYRETPYVSPMKSDLARFLDPERNPLLNGAASLTYFTLLDDGRPAGRIVAHVHHRSNEVHGWKRAYFGFFDCADDEPAARMLLEAAERFGRTHGCDEIAGNFNLTAMQQVGVTTEGFERAPYTDMHFNPEHVPRLLETCGYAPFFPMSTFETDLERFDPDGLLGDKQRALLEDPRLDWRTLRRRRLAEQMEAVRRVLNDGFADNPMFVPLTPEEIQFQAAEMMWIVDQRISCLVLEGGEPIGVVVCIPDLNPLLVKTGSRFKLSTPFHLLAHRMRRRRAVILFYSVSRRWHGRGLAGAMLHRVTTALGRAGYTRLGTTWIADENPASLRQMEKLGAERLHGLRLYRKDLGEAA